MNMITPRAAEPIVAHGRLSQPAVVHLLWSANSPPSTANDC